MVSRVNYKINTRARNNTKFSIHLQAGINQSVFIIDDYIWDRHKRYPKASKTLGLDSAR